MQGRHRSFGREITKSTVIYGVYTRFWPTLCISLRLGWPEPYIYGIFGREITNSTVMYGVYTQGWPEPYIYVHIRRIFGDFQVKNTVYIPYIHGSGQPYIYTILANLIYTRFWPTLYIHDSGQPYMYLSYCRYRLHAVQS